MEYQLKTASMVFLQINSAKKVTDLPENNRTIALSGVMIQTGCV
jgi:hypothetical protein